jgi:hypothetical protein
MRRPLRPSHSHNNHRGPQQPRHRLRRSQATCGTELPEAVAKIANCDAEGCCGVLDHNLLLNHAG